MNASFDSPRASPRRGLFYPASGSGPRKGFTLIEVLAVLLLLGILGVATQAFLPRSTASVTAEGDRLAAALRYTQGRALSDTVPWQLDWVSSGEYRIGRTGSDWVRIPGGEDDSHTLAPGISASPATTVFFDPWGRPANASGNPLNFDLTITLSDNASNTRTVTIVAETGWIP